MDIFDVSDLFKKLGVEVNTVDNLSSEVKNELKVERLFTVYGTDKLFEDFLLAIQYNISNKGKIPDNSEIVRIDNKEIVIRDSSELLDIPVKTITDRLNVFDTTLKFINTAASVKLQNDYVNNMFKGFDGSVLNVFEEYIMIANTEISAISGWSDVRTLNSVRKVRTEFNKRLNAYLVIEYNTTYGMFKLSDNMYNRIYKRMTTSPSNPEIIIEVIKLLCRDNLI